MIKKHLTSFLKTPHCIHNIYLNANRPMPTGPIVMDCLLHAYKTLLKLCKELNVTGEAIKQKLVVLEREKPLAKTLIDNTRERWLGLLYALHKHDREQLLKMFVDCCYSLEDGAAKTKIEEDSNHNLSYYFFFCLLLQNQKLINRIKKSTVKNFQNWRWSIRFYQLIILNIVRVLYDIVAAPLPSLKIYF